MLPPSQAAKRLSDAGYKASPDTVRRWCANFADMLSDGANANPRKLNNRDILVLLEVGRLRSANHTIAEIGTLLQDVSFSEVEMVEPSQSIAEDVGLPPAVSELVALLGQQSARIDHKMSAIDERLTNLERGRLNIPAMIYAFGLGVLVTLTAIMIASYFLS